MQPVSINSAWKYIHKTLVNIRIVSGNTDIYRFSKRRDPAGATQWPEARLFLCPNVNQWRSFSHFCGMREAFSLVNTAACSIDDLTYSTESRYSALILTTHKTSYRDGLFIRVVRGNWIRFLTHTSKSHRFHLKYVNFCNSVCNTVFGFRMVQFFLKEYFWNYNQNAGE